MGTAYGPRTLAVEFEATSKRAKDFAIAVRALAVEHFGEEADWYITTSFAPPEGWDRFKATINVSGR